MFTARERFSAQDRWWYFRLSAEAAAAYLRSIEQYDPDRPLPVTTPPAVMANGDSAMVERVAPEPVDPA